MKLDHLAHTCMRMDGQVPCPIEVSLWTVTTTSRHGDRHKSFIKKLPLQHPL